jgi:hypothetical protein
MKKLEEAGKSFGFRKTPGIVGNPAKWAMRSCLIKEL